MQVVNPKRAQFQKKLHFIPSDFPHFLKSTIGKELAPSITALVPPFPILLIELFSFEYRKTKTKVITLANHNSRKQRNEPIRTRSKNM